MNQSNQHAFGKLPVPNYSAGGIATPADGAGGSHLSLVSAEEEPEEQREDWNCLINAGNSETN